MRNVYGLTRRSLPVAAGPTAGPLVVEMIDLRAGASQAELSAPGTAEPLAAAVVQGSHLRAARGLVGWTLDQLAEASQLSVSTLRRLEDDVAAVSKKSRCRVIAALYVAGVRFILINGGAVAIVAAGELPGV